MAKKKQDIPDEPQEDSPIAIKRSRTYRDIVIAGDKRVATGNEDDGEPIEEAPEEVEEPIEEKVEEKVEDKPTAEDIAKVKEETKKEVLEELEAKDKAKEEELKKKEEESKIDEELVPVWEKEKREPKTYQEVMAETRRISRLEATREFEKRMAERDQKVQEEVKQKEEVTKQEEEKKSEYQKNLEKQLGDELDELVSIGKLTTKDPADKRFQEFMTFGTETNNKRIADGKLPLFPMALMNYYTPKAEQPAGADAPIVGNEGASEVEDVTLTPQQRRRMSYREIISYMAKATGLKK